MIKKRMIFFGLIVSLALFFTTVPSLATDDGDKPYWCPKGCTPGYWKNHTDSWVGYVPEQTLGSVFEFPADLAGLAGHTLLDALSYGGGPRILGGAKIMLRQAVAALLNSTHPDVPFHPEYWIIDKVNYSLMSLERDIMLITYGKFEYLNENLCPLD